MSQTNYKIGTDGNERVKEMKKLVIFGLFSFMLFLNGCASEESDPSPESISQNYNLLEYATTASAGTKTSGVTYDASGQIVIDTEIQAVTYSDSNESNRDSFAEIIENPFVCTVDMQVSTFSADVDTAAYSIVRNQLLRMNSLPNVHAVRTEEMVNYFDYDLEMPGEDEIFGVTTEIADAPWNEDHQLLMIGLILKTYQETISYSY